MATANGRPWYLDIVIGSAILAAVLVPLFGIQGRVGQNEVSILDLESRVERLRDNLALLDEIDLRIRQVEREVNQVERAREDILEAICAATARDGGSFDRCVRLAHGDQGGP